MYGGGINTNMNLVGKLPAFYRTRHILRIRQLQIGVLVGNFAGRYTASVHILRIRQLQFGVLVGNLPAGVLHPYTFYV